MARILGFDLSLRASGWAVCQDGSLVHHGLIEGKGTDIHRMIYVRNAVMEKIESQAPVDLLVFEDLAFGANMSFAKENAGLAYMIRAECVADKIPFVLVAPTALKKFVCGSAGSSKTPVKKEHMLMNVYKRWGHEVNDNNVCDGIGLAYLGMALMMDRPAETQAQKDVVEKLWKTYPVGSLAKR